MVRRGSDSSHSGRRGRFKSLLIASKAAAIIPSSFDAPAAPARTRGSFGPTVTSVKPPTCSGRRTEHRLVAANAPVFDTVE